MSISAALYPIGVIDAHAGSGAGAAVVPSDEELAVAEPLHHLDLILRHRAEGIVDIVFAAVFGAYAVAITSEVGGDHMKILGQPRRDLVPGDMRHRVAVQQQQWRAIAAVAKMDSRTVGLDFRLDEPFEHPLVSSFGVKPGGYPTLPSTASAMQGRLAPHGGERVRWGTAGLSSS